MPHSGSDEKGLNIRDLPWVRAEELRTLTEGRGLIVLPDYDVVLKQAKEVFEKARAVDAQTWKETKGFLKEDAVRDYLHALVVAYHELLRSATNTTVYCNYKDQNGNLCGSIMDITVDATGVYYQCRLDRYSHVRPVP